MDEPPTPTHPTPDPPDGLLDPTRPTMNLLHDERRAGEKFTILSHQEGPDVRIHRCDLPGSGRIARWVHRLSAGAEVRCNGCGKVWILRDEHGRWRWEIHPGWRDSPFEPDQGLP